MARPTGYRKTDGLPSPRPCPSISRNPFDHNNQKSSTGSPLVNKAIAAFIKLGWIQQVERRYVITNRRQLEIRAR